MDSHTDAEGVVRFRIFDQLWTSGPALWDEILGLDEAAFDFHFIN